MTKSSAKRVEKDGGKEKEDFSEILNMLMSLLSDESSGARKFLEEMFRYLGRQCYCVVKLRLVCKTFDEIIRKMKPSLSCKPNIIRNIERGLRGTFMVPLSLSPSNRGREAALLCCTETTAVVRILKTNYIIINLSTHRQRLLYYTQDWHVCIGDRFVCFGRGNAVLLHDKDGNLLTRIELNCCWPEISPHHYYVQALERNFFIIRDNEQVLKFEVYVPGDGSFYVQLLHSLGLERRHDTVARFPTRAKISTDGRTYLLYSYCHMAQPIIIGEVFLWREKDQYCKSVLFLLDHDGEPMGVSDVAATSSCLLGIIRDGGGVRCWDLETGEITRCIYSDPTSSHLRLNITDKDCEIIETIPCNETFTFMIDWQTLAISGVLTEFRKSFKTMWTNRKCLKIVEDVQKKEKSGMKYLCIENYTFHQD